jgi:hypothetical protein
MTDLRKAAEEALDRMVAENERLGLYDDQPNLVYRLRKRAEIRRQIPDRRSVQEGKPDRIADLLEEAADYIEKLEEKNSV